MTSPGSIACAPATAQLAALTSGEISSSELLEIFLERAAARNGEVNAIVTLDEDGARRAAVDADRARAAGEHQGPLHGLPMTIKDAIEVGGLRSTGGARELADHVPSQDAPAVARLRAAGAVIFGKTNAPAWSADIQTSNELFGTTSNPWDLSRTSGGSSGGAAAAVACGFTGLELGTDIGGSVRIPSHCCGTFALKPTYGVISQRGYLDRVGGGTTDADINVFGPIARSADDLALALSVLAGPDDDQLPGWRLELPVDDPQRPAGPIGVWLDEPSCPLDPAVREILADAAKRLNADGMAVEDDHPPVNFERQAQLAQHMIGAAVSAGSAGPLGGTHGQWLLAQAERKELERVWRQWFGRFDALLCPVLGVPAFPHDTARPLMERTVEIDGQHVPHVVAIGWLGLIGLMGLPSAVAPVGHTSEGLPVGIQIVTPWYQDYRAIAIARRMEALCGGYQVPPGF